MTATFQTIYNNNSTIRCYTEWNKILILTLHRDSLWKKSGNCYTTYVLRCLASEKHVTVKWRMLWSLDRSMVWKHVCSASSGMHSPDRQEVFGGPAAGLILILVRNRSKLSFHSCNYDIFTGWCPCTPLATCTHKCHVLHFLSHWDADAEVEIH